MKKTHLLPILAAAALLASGCGALFQTPEEKAAEDARVAALVPQRLDARSYRINVNYMQPRRGGQQALNTPYAITVDGTHLNSYLPYFGVAYDLPYGGGKGLNFESEIDAYSDTPRRDRRTIEFTTYNGEDYFYYRLEVFDNGRTSIRVQSRKRESIDYLGELDPDYDPAAEAQKRAGE